MTTNELFDQISAEKEALYKEIDQLRGERNQWRIVAEEMYEWLEFYKGSSYTEWHDDTDKVMKMYEQLKEKGGEG